MASTRKLLVKRLGRARGELKAWTGLGLGILERNAAERGERATPAVTRALRDTFKRSRSNEVSGAIAIALGMIRDLEAVELLRERMLESGEENMRSYSCIALGMIGNVSVTEDLRRVLAVSTNKPVVIENAAIALSLLGDDVAAPKFGKARAFVLDRLPRAYRYTTDDAFVHQAQGNLYFWYYGTLALFRVDGEPWEMWNEGMKDALLPAQAEDGSWRPISIYATDYAGDTNRDRSYSTAMCVLTLEVYYRYFTPLLKVE